MKRKTSPLYILYVFVICFFLIWVLNNCVSVPSGVDRDTHKKILSAIERVHYDELAGYDLWFKDNDYDCKDRAVAFYHYYNGQCRITVNEKLNHAYIQIWTGTSWLAIDPGAYGYSSYTMRYVWGNSYDGRDIDRTESYLYWYKVYLGVANE